MSIDQLMQTDIFDVYVIPWSVRIVTAILIFVIGRWIAKLLTNAVGRVMTKARLDDLLVNFLSNIIYALLLAVVVLAALEQLGVKTTSALAILGAAGLAVGLALRDSLSNFAAGVMLIIFRPFKTGDFVEAGGTAGVVEKITVFSTVMRTGDNREVIIPNGQIAGGTIINFSARDTRRIDLVFGIGYDDDIKKAKELIEQTMKADARILADPAPAIMVLELADSSVNLAVRPWCNSGDYWAVRSDLLENVKAAFDSNGISIPFPQRDVHLHQVDSAA
ncbi:MAG: mechanosensitive ion channel protein MscS [Gammaproteobacteria bacterium SG8_47]|nr:MAG: mechanosensitive ion channel protein MscS [Gammaproteobacteria bacterium SG8_47]